MKTRSISLFTGMLLISLLATLHAASQMQKNPALTNNSAGAGTSNAAAAVYTYRVFEAPNKMFGYDIFKNGKGMFHQPAGIVQPNNPALSEKQNTQNTAFTEKQNTQNIILPKKENAEGAAMLSIEKIKKQLPPVLTSEEIQKIISQ